MEKFYDTPVFNGTAGGVNCQDKSIELRYHGVCGICDLNAYNAFKCLDHMQPGYTLDYDDWQQIVYAARLLAKNYDWFANMDTRNERFKDNMWKCIWNPDTEEYDWAKGHERQVERDEKSVEKISLEEWYKRPECVRAEMEALDRQKHCNCKN